MPKTKSSKGSGSGSRNSGNKNRPSMGGSTTPQGYADSRPQEADKKQSAK